MVYITFPDVECARHIGTLLVGKQLAACVNLIPGIESIYQWEDEVRNDSEVLAMVKTTVARYSQLEREVLKEHPYENPEIIALNIERGSELYLNWVQDQIEGRH